MIQNGCSQKLSNGCSPIETIQQKVFNEALHWRTSGRTLYLESLESSFLSSEIYGLKLESQGLYIVEFYNVEHPKREPSIQCALWKLFLEVHERFTDRCSWLFIGRRQLEQSARIGKFAEYFQKEPGQRKMYIEHFTLNIVQGSAPLTCIRWILKKSKNSNLLFLPINYTASEKF